MWCVHGWFLAVMACSSLDVNSLQQVCLDNVMIILLEQVLPHQSSLG